MKKLPNGISDYERLVENNYLYVDKTKYIEKLENLSQPYIMFLQESLERRYQEKE